jgi:hypothetical protein
MKINACKIKERSKVNGDDTAVNGFRKIITLRKLL